MCGSADLKLMRHSAVHGFDVARCRRCKMAFVLDQPDTFATEGQYIEGGDCTPYVEIQRAGDTAHRQAMDRLRSLVRTGDRKPLLFDVGAGVGDFLVEARKHGFDISGNEISPVAIEYTRDRHGIELSPLMLDEQPPASVDAITMWCVLAHVPDPAKFVRGAYEMLRPGGVLFIRTPRWCLVDTVGLAVDRVTSGRLNQVADRRITPMHLHLFNQRNLGRLLSDSGFTDVDVESVCHYPLTTDLYVEASLGRKKSIGTVAVRGLDKLISRGWFIRNAMFAYARRPMEE